MNDIIQGLAELPLIVRGSQNEVFKAIRELQEAARKVVTAPAESTRIAGEPNTGGFTCDCCQRNMELRIDGKFCNECAASRAQPSPSLADAIAKVREMRDELQRRYNESKIFDVADRYATQCDGLEAVITVLKSLTPSDVVLVSREEAAKVVNDARGEGADLRELVARIRSLPAYGDRKDG